MPKKKLIKLINYEGLQLNLEHRVPWILAPAAKSTGSDPKEASVG
jgi:hypothetical protein